MPAHDFAGGVAGQLVDLAYFAWRFKGCEIIAAPGAQGFVIKLSVFIKLDKSDGHLTAHAVVFADDG